MSKPTALLIPSPWSGDEADPIPASYRWWFRLYVTTRRLRHKLGLHDYRRIHPLHGVRFLRCSWCGHRRVER
ncbi:hypothetical protein M2302_000280 [Micromonospora sp. A200]|uniref:hypothetical protein n=1 Tax=Micromonospora sp. A200 TaxID=2940568 RepID=UPI002472FC32|nr:hypothetical protein [Micromonospora sp. A200]MDH6460129.1 hypothetical protein [Micromonospora sp. A200]